MPLHIVNLDRAIQRVADRAIRDAVEQGKFDNLEGAGQPLTDADKPYDDNWWIRSWINRERLRQIQRETTGQPGGPQQ